MAFNNKYGKPKLNLSFFFSLNPTNLYLQKVYFARIKKIKHGGNSYINYLFRDH